jgi:hypothetical protein
LGIDISNRNCIIVPLPVFLVLAVLAPTAVAANAGAEAAAQLLAKAHVADDRCHFLQGADHDDLSTLVARAEVALASQSDMATTKSAMAAGRAAGNTATCSPQLKSEVEDILSAARAASGISASATDPVASTGPTLPQTATVAPNADLAHPSSSQIKPRINGGLANYAAMTERYYRARRCFSMSRTAINSFYQEVVATHRAMVRTYGVPAVAAVMHRSESTADHQGCG